MAITPDERTFRLEGGIPVNRDDDDCYEPQADEWKEARPTSDVWAHIWDKIDYSVQWAAEEKAATGKQTYAVQVLQAVVNVAQEVLAADKPDINHRVTLFIPTTGQDGEVLAADKRNEGLAYAKRRLAQFFGGYTVYQANGGWIDGDGALVEEEVTVVEVYTTLTTRLIKRCLGPLAAGLAVELDQDCVLWTLDAEAFFVRQAAAADQIDDILNAD